MKTRSSIKKRGPKDQIVRRKGRLFRLSDTPRHKARQ